MGGASKRGGNWAESMGAGVVRSGQSGLCRKGSPIAELGYPELG